MARGGQSAAREPATEPLPSSPIHVAEAQVAGQTPLGAALLLIFPLRLRPDSELPKNHSMGLFNSWTLLHGAKKKGSKLCQPPFRLPEESLPRMEPNAAPPFCPTDCAAHQPTAIDKHQPSSYRTRTDSGQQEEEHTELSQRFGGTQTDKGARQDGSSYTSLAGRFKTVSLAPPLLVCVKTMHRPWRSQCQQVAAWP